MGRSAIIRLCLAIGALLLVAAGGPATAATLRYPTATSPAFAFDVPDDWQVKDDGTNLQIFPSGRYGFVQVSLGQADDLPANTDVKLAGDILKAAGLPPFERSAKSRLAGVAGTTFYVTGKLGDGGAIAVRLTLARLDSTHLAVELDALLPVATPQQSAALDALIAGFRFVGR